MTVYLREPIPLEPAILGGWGERCRHLLLPGWQNGQDVRRVIGRALYDAAVETGLIVEIP